MRSVTIIFKSLYACQHKCGFCHVLYVPRNTSYMWTDEVKKTFDRIEERFAGCRVDLDMTGGEFALRKDAVELIEYLRTKEIELGSLVLDTMAVPFADAELARRLGGLFDRANVSIHAADPETHAEVSASRTHFEKLRAGLVNLFKYFPAIHTNTSINRFNHDRLCDIAKLVLKSRFASGREAPLYCAYYLPVYRYYGEAEKENEKRLQGLDNAEFLPHGSKLDEVRAELDRARSLLQRHDVTASLRDFNYPACVYRRVTGSYPEHSYGLPNFMNDTYFADYRHPIEAGHTLEDVYPSIYERTKAPVCQSCIAEPVCPGITKEWRRMGYEVEAIDEAEYEAGFPERLLNRTFEGVFRDPDRISELVDRLPLDWGELASSFYGSLSRGDDLRSTRDRIAGMSPMVRGRALSRHLCELGGTARGSLAVAIDEEIRGPIVELGRPRAFARIVERTL